MKSQGPSPTFAGLALCLACVSSVLAAEPATVVTHVLNRIPRTPQELSELHDRSSYPSFPLPAGVPLAQRTFGQRVMYDVKLPRPGGAASGSLLFDWGRWPIIDYGTRMSEADQKDLPFFTSGVILDVVNKTYVSLQVRVHRAAPDGQPYLHYVPITAVADFGKLDATTEFSALQQLAVSNVRGLGLFLKPEQPREPRSLRTLVVSIKGHKIIPNKEVAEIQTEPTLELLLVRMRTDAATPDPRVAEAVQLHAFGTTEGLTKLVQFKPYATPANSEDCTIRSTIRITEYAVAGQLPSARAAREVRIRADKEFALPALDRYARSAGLAGDAFDNLTEILDAIIDGKLR